MNIIKTKIKNKVGDGWMNNSMPCYIERDVLVDIKCLITVTHERYILSTTFTDFVSTYLVYTFL
jgi:hypothetical protein